MLPTALRHQALQFIASVARMWGALVSKRDFLLAFLAPEIAALRKRAGENFHRVELGLIDWRASLASVKKGDGIDQNL